MAKEVLVCSLRIKRDIFPYEGIKFLFDVRVNERYAWTVDYEGTLTGTRFRTDTRSRSNPACPSLIRKSSFFRSADRD